jgi:hypothetical protein
MQVIQIPQTSIARAKGTLAKFADADVVIACNGVVLKDRNGKAPRWATASELLQAKKLH